MSIPAFPAGIWACDFEFNGREGENPLPVCMVSQDLTTGTSFRLWQDELAALPQVPFPVGSDALFVAYNASAEMGCFRQLGWAPPANVLDLFAEFCNLTNGLAVPAGRGLIGALVYFGAPSMDISAKEAMLDFILAGGPWTKEDREAILNYCEQDVIGLRHLFDAMTARNMIDWPRALLRGAFSIPVATMEDRGVPIDTDLLEAMRANGPALRPKLIAAVDKDFGVYEDGHFRIKKFSNYLASRRIRWPTTPNGRLCLDDDTFNEMAVLNPEIAPLQQLRWALRNLREIKLTVGKAGRNKYQIRPFGSITGRSQPSTNKAIFGLPKWIRGLVQPPPGRAIAYIDFAQQELAIAAKLSGDKAMQEAYLSGDFYMTFAIQAGAAPPGATKVTHPQVRAQFKECALGVLYGMTERGLARKLGITVAEGTRLLAAHRRTYAKFWRWSTAVVDYAQLRGKLQSVFGWTLHVSGRPNPRQLANFPMQSNGAEMLRLACIDMSYAGKWVTGGRSGGVE